MKQRIIYQDGNSFIHFMHPLVKLSWLLFFTVFVFITPHLWMVLGLLFGIVLLIYVSNLKFTNIRGLRLVITTAILLAILQVIFTTQGEILFSFWQIGITELGIRNGLYIAARFVSVVFASYLFVLTTQTNDLAYALIQTGFPYRYGFALVTAIRLVPVFEQEAIIVYEAQLARGVQYNRKNINKFILLAKQFFLPMLVSALSKVDALAVSMEGRCFGKYTNRTFLREVRYSKIDFCSIGILIIVIFITLVTF
jgi:energy-coupling factor transport system permease protein